MAEIGSACIPKLMGQALDLIHRLQAENAEQKKELDRLKKFEVYRINEMKKQKAEIERLTEDISRIKTMTAEQAVESEKLKNSIAEAVNSFVRLETLYKIKCKELEIANKKLEELNGGKVD